MGQVSSCKPAALKLVTCLVNVMMDMLACDDGRHGVALLGATACASTLELSTLLFQTSLDGGRIAVMELTVLYRDNVVLMLFWKDFAILDGLNGCVEMVLVNFTIDGGLSLFMTMFDDSLLGHSGSDFLMNGCIMMSSLVPNKCNHQP